MSELEREIVGCNSCNLKQSPLFSYIRYHSWTHRTLIHLPVVIHPTLHFPLFPLHYFLWTPGEVNERVPRRGNIYLSHTNTRENNGNNGERPLPHSSWTTAIQSGSRDARRYQSHQRTQVNVLWQRGGRGWLRG